MAHWILTDNSSIAKLSALPRSFVHFHFCHLRQQPPQPHLTHYNEDKSGSDSAELHRARSGAGQRGDRRRSLTRTGHDTNADRELKLFDDSIKRIPRQYPAPGK